MATNLTEEMVDNHSNQNSYTIDSKNFAETGERKTKWEVKR